LLEKRVTDFWIGGAHFYITQLQVQPAWPKSPSGIDQE
jgi:hypothetical protein